MNKICLNESVGKHALSTPKDDRTDCQICLWYTKYMHITHINTEMPIIRETQSAS